MRVGLFSDIHGDLVALEATLAALATDGVDALVCLGDLALGGPQPEGCIQRVRELGCPVVRGNCDDVIPRMRSEGRSPELMAMYTRYAPWVAEIDFWSAESISADSAAYLAALPLTATVGPRAGDEDAWLLCAHGSPTSNRQRLKPETPDGELVRLVGEVKAFVLASGHTHLPMARRLTQTSGKALTVVNPGSVGLPMAAEPSTGALYNPSGYAEYAIVTWDEAAHGEPPQVELRRAQVDPEAQRAAAFASGMPFPDRWRDSWT